MTKYSNSSAHVLQEDVMRELGSYENENPSSPAVNTSQNHARFFGEAKLEQAEHSMKHSFISEWGIDDKKD